MLYTEKIHSDGLKTIGLQRWVKKDILRGRKIVQMFFDEFGKTTFAKWVLKSIGDESYWYRLDGRSIRYMKRVEVIENA